MKVVRNMKWSKSITNLLLGVDEGHRRRRGQDGEDGVNRAGREGGRVEARRGEGPDHQQGSAQS